MLRNSVISNRKANLEKLNSINIAQESKIIFQYLMSILQEVMPAPQEHIGFTKESYRHFSITHEHSLKTYTHVVRSRQQKGLSLNTKISEVCLLLPKRPCCSREVHGNSLRT